MGGKKISNIARCLGQMFALGLAMSCQGAAENSGQPQAISDITVLTGHDQLIPGLVFTRDGQDLTSIGWDKTIRFWNLAAGKETERLVAHTKNLSGLALSPDGSLLATGAQDDMVRLWDMKTRNQISEWHDIRTPKVAFRPMASLSPRQIMS